MLHHSSRPGAGRSTDIRIECFADAVLSDLFHNYSYYTPQGAKLLSSGKGRRDRHQQNILQISIDLPANLRYHEALDWTKGVPSSVRALSSLIAGDLSL